MKRNIILKADNKERKFPVVIGTEKEKGIDISKLRAETGYITLDPGYANAYTSRGVLYTDSGAYVTAIIDHGRAIEIDPDFAEAYYNRAIAYLGISAFEDAVSDYNQAFRLGFQPINLFNNRGLAYFRMSEYEMALADYNHAIEMDPTDAGAYVLRARIYATIENYHDCELALADLDRYLELVSDTSELDFFQHEVEQACAEDQR